MERDALLRLGIYESPIDALPHQATLVGRRYVSGTSSIEKLAAFDRNNFGLNSVYMSSKGRIR